MNGSQYQATGIAGGHDFKGSLTTVNYSAIPGNLIESELFGYEKGALSGANKVGKKGLIEESANGTLFLDEVGDLSPEAQAKLLRFLEAGEFYRVVGTKKIIFKPVWFQPPTKISIK